MMYFLNYAIGIIGALLSKFGLPDTSPDFSLNGSLLYNIFTFTSVVILAPIFEELIFRGMILQTLSKYNKMFCHYCYIVVIWTFTLEYYTSHPCFLYGAGTMLYVS